MFYTGCQLKLAATADNNGIYRASQRAEPTAQVELLLNDPRQQQQQQLRETLLRTNSVSSSKFRNSVYIFVFVLYICFNFFILLSFVYMICDNVFIDSV